MFRHPAALLIVLAFAIPASSVTARFAQAPSVASPAGTGLIVGRVTDGSTGAVVRDAVVTLKPSSGPAVSVLVDSSGRFVFSNLLPGRTSIESVKSGYMTGGIGKARADGATQMLDLR